MADIWRLCGVVVDKTMKETKTRDTAVPRDVCLDDNKLEKIKYKPLKDEIAWM